MHAQWCAMHNDLPTLTFPGGPEAIKALPWHARCQPCARALLAFVSPRLNVASGLPVGQAQANRQQAGGGGRQQEVLRRLHERQRPGRGLHESRTTTVTPGMQQGC